MENTSRGVRNVPLEILNFDEDELVDSDKAIVAATDKALDDELETELVEEEEILEDIEEVELEEDEDE